MTDAADDYISQAELYQMIPSRTDADVAREIRKELLAKLAEAGLIIDKATAHGLIVNYTMRPGQFGKQVIDNVQIMRPL